MRGDPIEATNEGRDVGEVIDLAIVQRVRDPDPDPGVEVDREPALATHFTTIQDSASVIDLWFQSRAGTTTAVWIDGRPSVHVGDFIVDVGGKAPVVAGGPTVPRGAASVIADASAPLASRATPRPRTEMPERVRAALGPMPWPDDRPHPMFGDARQALVHIDRTHRPVHVRPSADPSLSYLLPVPVGWQAALDLPVTDLSARGDVIGLFAADTGEEAPRLVVRTSRPRWEVDPLEWVRTSLVLAGWRIAIARCLDQPSGRFEICAVRSGERGLEIRRCVGFLDGGRIVRVDAIAPAHRWRAVHDLVWPCGMLLELDDPTERARIEAWRAHEGPLVRFSLPESWCAAGLPQGECRSMRWIADIADGAQADAGVRVDVTDRRSRAGQGGGAVEDRRAALRDDLRTRGIVLGRRFDRLPPAEDPGAELPGWLGTWACEAVDPQGGRYDLRLSHRDLGEARLDYVMLSPPPDTHRLDWMRATRAFAIAVGTTALAGARL